MGANKKSLCIGEPLPNFFAKVGGGGGGGGGCPNSFGWVGFVIIFVDKMSSVNS